MYAYISCAYKSTHNVQLWLHMKFWWICKNIFSFDECDLDLLYTWMLPEVVYRKINRPNLCSQLTWTPNQHLQVVADNPELGLKRMYAYISYVYKSTHNVQLWLRMKFWWICKNIFSFDECDLDLLYMWMLPEVVYRKINRPNLCFQQT